MDWRRRLDQLTPEQRTAADCKWIKERPALLPRGMVLAGRTLFIAGLPMGRSCPSSGSAPSPSSTV